MEESVKIEKLGNIVDVKGGKRLPKGISLISTPNNHPYIRIRDLGASKILELNSAYEYVDDETQKTIARYIVSSGDILISIVGTIGLVGIVGDSLHGANQTENCVKLVNLKGIDRDYLYYFLSSNLGQNEIKRGIVGAVQSKLPIKNIENINIPLPSLALQKSIASILSSLDSKIELNRRINDNLEQQAQALFKSWFVDFEPFGSGSMPDDWEICEAQKYFKINIGKTPPRNETKWFSKNIDDYKWASIADLGKCGLFISNTSEYLTKEAVNTFNIIIVPKGTVLLSFKLTLGRTAITTCPLTTNEAIARFLVNNDYEREYLYLLLRQYDYTSLGNTSSIATAVNSKIIKNMPIMMPPIDILQQFHTVVSPLFNRMQSLSDELTQLAETRDTLLPRLMSGELKISETETQTTNHG